MTHKIHSPFLVVENFISPSICEKLISELGIKDPTSDEAGKVFKNERILKDTEYVHLFKSRIQEHVSTIEQKYSASVVGMENPIFTQYFEDAKNPCEPHGCENAKYLRKKWVKVKDVDLVGFVWLKDFNNGVPLDPRFEVYGGKLEFAGYNFSLVPQRGTLVLFPAGPHFITAISPVLVGSLEQVKFSIKLKADNQGGWVYQPANFPGSYQEWFSELE